MNSEPVKTAVLVFVSILSVLAAAANSAAAGELNSRQPNDNNPSYGSKVEFIVERYHLDEAAQKEYDKLHPPVHTMADLNAKMLMLKFSLQHYRDWLKAADEIIQHIFGDVPSSKAPSIDGAFAPIESAVDNNLESISKLIGQYGGSLPAIPVAPEVIAAYHQLEPTLRGLNLGNSPDDLAKRISTTVSQLQQSNVGSSLTQRLDNAMNAIKQLGADQQVAEAAVSLVHTVETFANNPAVEELKIRQIVSQKASFAAEVKDAATDLQEVGGDLLERKYAVYQDLSDPFVDYISLHPEGWNRIANHGLVAGDGDTQFIIVFENQLDGRFNFVSVDPTKVIQARMRIGRQVAQNLVSLAGVATKAFGVPIPASLVPGQAETNSETIDFSKMTAAETQMKLQNGVDQRNMDALRKYAVGALANFPSDPVKADEIRKDLIRRLQPYINK